jgi:hypothetical protein
MTKGHLQIDGILKDDQVPNKINDSVSRIIDSSMINKMIHDEVSVQDSKRTKKND